MDVQSLQTLALQNFEYGLGVFLRQIEGRSCEAYWQHISKGRFGWKNLSQLTLAFVNSVTGLPREWLKVPIELKDIGY